MRIFLAFLLSLFVITSWTQTLTISGTVLDRLSHEPLPFASIGIKGKSISTVSNLQGEFDFHIPNEYRNEILSISMLGFENFEEPVWSLISAGTREFKMNKSTTVLDEVVITDSLDGSDILRISISKIESNYASAPFMLHGFYRDVKRVGGTYISLLEAAVKIYDENYEEPRNKFRLRERVKLVELRKSLGYENRFTPYFDQANLLEDLLLQNDIRYRHIQAEVSSFTNIKREHDSFYNGHAIHVLSHTSADFFIKIFVDKQDYSIIHIEYRAGESDDILLRKKRMISKYKSIKRNIDFRRYQGKMYLNYMAVTSVINWYDSKTKKLKFETELQQQLLINKVQTHTKERIGSTEKMKNYGLQFQEHPYNKTFWENYNVIKETPLDKKIVSDLGKEVPLDKQFEN